jgi:hypothetical protein
MRRKVLILFLLLLLTGGGYLLWKVYFTKGIQADAFAMVPADAVFIVETDEPIESWRSFSSSEMWQHLKGFTPLGDIGKMADGLDEIISQNATLFGVFGQRNILISAHLTSPKTYDFLYVADMKDGAKIGPVKDGIITLLKQAGFDYSSLDVEGEKVHRFANAADKSTLNLAFVANRVVLSFSESIITASLREYQNPTLSKDARFSQVLNNSPSGGLFRFFLNYEALPGYLGVYMEQSSIPTDLLKSMTFTGASADLNERRVMLDGMTGVNDSMSSYIRALALSGSTKTGAASVFSNQTAFMLNMGFKDFRSFFDNLKEVMHQDPKAEADFNKNSRLLERLLNISIQDHVVSWIGDEVSIAQYRQDRVIGGKINNIIAIRPASMDLAKRNLEHIEKMIRRRTPLKFKSYTYKEHEIHYLEIKGLFKLLFGKLFGKMEKPFYTFLGDYVVFSDDPRMLLQTIEDHMAGNTLANNDSYQTFRSDFSGESSVFAYVNLPRYFVDMKGLLHPSKWQSINANKPYVLCFPQIGFQFTAEDGNLNTIFSAEFHKPEEADLIIPELQAASADSLAERDSLSDVDQFLIENINGDVHREFYDNGNVKFIAEMKEERFHGRYLEYWENGQVKVKGKYRDGEKIGKWRFYNEEGVFERRERFGKKEEDTEVPEQE